MCKYNTLYYHKAEGYIIHCLECENIQVGFGNISLTLSIPAFYDFYAYIKDIAAAQPYHDDPFTRCIAICTPCHAVQLLLSPKELGKLLLMLNAADTELRTQELVSLFKEGK